MTHDAIHLGTRARVTPASSLDMDRLLDLAKQRAPDPSIFETFTPSFWQVCASSNRLDFYYTRMRPGKDKTLGNFERGLKDGVSYQDSHNPFKNGWGQSIDGTTVTTDETDPEIKQKITEVWGSFFTLSGLTLGGQSTDDFTAAIRAGVWRDVSVGFYATDIECGLCGKQAFQWWKEDGCMHLPGLEYELADGKGGTFTATAWAWINDGKLSEVSQVYDGASPGAAVLKAEQMSLEGALDEGDRARIERRYSCRIATPARRFALGGLPGRGKDQPMAVTTPAVATRNQDATSDEAEVQADATEDDTVIKPTVAETDDDETVIDNEDGDDSRSADSQDDVDSLDAERKRFAPHGIRIGTNPAKAIRTLGDEVIRLRGVVEERSALARIGERYRDDLIEEAVKAGVRAHGTAFDEAQYRSDFSGMSIDSIKRWRDLFNSQGDEALGGGRRTRETEEDAPPQEESGKRKTNDPDAYRA